MRRDSLGFFWTDLPQEPASRQKKVWDPNAPLPIIPETGWEAPKEFPRLDAVKTIAFDTETKDVDLIELGPGFRRGAHMIGCSVATHDRAWYFPFRHEVCKEQNLNPENVIAWIKDQVARPGLLKVGANLLYDLDACSADGIDIEGPFYDVQTTEALLNENRFEYNLDALGRDYTGRGKEEAMLAAWIAEAYGNRSNFREDLWRSPPCLVGFYGEQDARLPLQIRQQQIPLLEADDLMELNEMEQSLIPMLLAMRLRGVRVDLGRAQELEESLTKGIIRLQDRMDEFAGLPIDVDSATSLAAAFDKLGLEYPLTAKTKKPSFVKEWLEHHPSPIAKVITEQRTLKKFRDTFIRGHILGHHTNGRIHCVFNQNKGEGGGAVSGRFSSSDPNLQNIPTRDEEWGVAIRSIFLPDEGCNWAKLDWSQIEFRLVAHYGRGPTAEEVRRRYREDPTTDFHLAVAEMIWPAKAAAMRKAAKSINFGLVYGMGEDTLANEVGIPVEKARPIFAEYHGKMPFIKAGTESLYKEAQTLATSRGYIRTLLGRRRRFHLWEPYGKRAEFVRALPMKEAEAEWGHRIRRAFTHKALNGLIQGSAADLMKKAMVDYWGSAARRVLGAPMLTVHDELDFSEPMDDAGRKALLEVKEIMESAVRLKVPVIADTAWGPDWGHTK